MSLALQILVTGLAAGGVYGLVAVGHSLLYRLTGIVHLAFGDLVGLGVFATLLFAAGTAPITSAGVGAGRFLVALAGGLAVCVAAGIGTYLLAIQPALARGSVIGWVAGTAAVAFALRSAIEAVFDRPSYAFPDPLPFHDVGHDGVVTLGGASIQVRAGFVIALAFALALLATWVLDRTRFGRGLQAIASDPEGADIVGIPVERLVALAFGLAGGLAALAAVAAAPSAPFAADTGALLGVKGLAAAVVVGFASPLRSFAAGLVFGVAEAAIASGSVAGHGLGPGYAVVLPLAAALFVVAVRAVRRPALEAV